MKFKVLMKNVDDEKLVHDYVTKKLHFALDRIAERISDVVVHIEDETRNSPAFDGLCKIAVDLLPRGSVHVDASGESMYDCVLNAVRKMENAVKRDIDRHRNSSNIRHQQDRSRAGNPL